MKLSGTSYFYPEDGTSITPDDLLSSSITVTFSVPKKTLEKIGQTFLGKLNLAYSPEAVLVLTIQSIGIPLKSLSVLAGKPQDQSLRCLWSMRSVDELCRAEVEGQLSMLRSIGNMEISHNS